MKGKLYGIGVGPGDSELMTVKAARIVGEADVIITPKTEKKDGSVALNIAKPYIQEHTEIVPVVFPMVLDDATQQEGWEEAKRVIVSYLEQGKNVVFLTLGDPMFYSTYMYVYRLIENTGFEIETIPGITAFCAIGSHLGYPIVEKEEVLYIGDSDVDVYTGRAAGVKTVAVKWGYRSAEVLMEAKPDYIIESPKQIIKIIDGI